MNYGIRVNHRLSAFIELIVMRANNPYISESSATGTIFWFESTEVRDTTQKEINSVLAASVYPIDSPSIGASLPPDRGMKKQILQDGGQ